MEEMEGHSVTAGSWVVLVIVVIVRCFPLSLWNGRRGPCSGRNHPRSKNGFLAVGSLPETRQQTRRRNRNRSVNSDESPGIDGTVDN